MIAEARKRTAGHAKLRFEETSGLDLAAFAAGSFDSSSPSTPFRTSSRPARSFSHDTFATPSGCSPRVAI
jgi:hypothetical protein